jgi:hypothetical protein
MKRLLCLTTIMLCAALASAQTSFWKNERGEAQPDTESRKSKNDFATRKTELKLRTSFTLH